VNRLSKVELNCAATAAPTAAIATKPATRDTALFTPDATPACCASAPPSTAAVSGATVTAIPKPKTSTPGSTSGK
jgi:hypothetical protein